MMEPTIKRLFRSKTDRVILGVAGGLGVYFGIDPVLVRVAFVILALIHGMGIIGYLILAIVMPREPEEHAAPKTREEEIKESAKEFQEAAQSTAESIRKEVEDIRSEGWASRGRNLIGISLVGLGVVLLLEEVMEIHILRSEFLWPLALVVVGLFILLNRGRR